MQAAFRVYRSRIHAAQERAAAEVGGPAVESISPSPAPEPGAGALLYRLRQELSLYSLLYGSYIAAWRMGRWAALGSLSCGMCALCVGTGLVLQTARLARGSAGLLSALAACAGQRALRALRLAPAPPQPPRRGAAVRGVGSSSAPSPPSSVSGPSGPRRTSSGGEDRLASHPLPLGGRARGAHGADSDSGARGRPRPGLGRRCGAFAVRLAKLAGASLLLGRVSRGGGLGQGRAVGGGGSSAGGTPPPSPGPHKSPERWPPPS